MRRLRHIGLALVLVAGLVLLAAALARPTHELLHHLGLAESGERSFLKVLRRLLLFLLLPVLLLGLRPWRDGDLESYGLRGAHARRRPFAICALVTLAIGLALLTWHMAAGWIHWEDPIDAERALRRIAKRLVFPAFGVALCEELFFRGWLERRTERWAPPLATALGVSALYAILHAFRPSQLDRAVSMDFAGALAALEGWMRTAVDLQRFGSTFVGLLLFGLVLSAAYRRSRTLWAPIGIHMAGAWLLYSYGALTDRPEPQTWAGGKLLYDGWPVWVLLGVFFVLLWPWGSRGVHGAQDPGTEVPGPVAEPSEPCPSYDEGMPRVLLLALLTAAAGGAWWLLSAEPPEAAELESFEAADDAALSSGPALVGQGREGPSGARAGRGGAGASTSTSSLVARAAAVMAVGATEGGAPVPFRGMVLDTRGRPAVDVEILLASEGGVIRLRSDDEGRFDQTVAAGRYAVLLLGGTDGARFMRHMLLDGARGDDLVFDLRAPVTAEVRVRRGNDPLPEVSVELELDVPGALARRTSTTDVAGAVRFEGMPPGAYRIRAKGASTPEMLAKTSFLRDRTHQFAMPDAVRLFGTVRAGGAEGPPVPSALVTLEVEARRSSYRVGVETGPDGTYDVMVPRGSPSRFDVEAEGFAIWPDASTRKRVVRGLRRLRGGKPVQRDVVLRGGRMLTGVIRDLKGVPVPGLELQAVVRRSEREPVTATTDEAGRYALPNLDAGDWVLAVRTRGIYPASDQQLRVRVPAQQTQAIEHDLQVVVARRISGRVIESEGEPAAGARVWLTGGGKTLYSAREAGRPLETFTTRDGRFVLTDVPSDRAITLRARIGKLESSPQRIAADERADDVRLDLSPTAHLHGTVVDRENGEPLQGVTVRLHPVAPQEGRGTRSATSDRLGRYRIHLLLPGKYTLTLSRRRYLTSTPVEVTAPPSGGEMERRDDIDPGHLFGGVVVDDGGRAVPRATISFKRLVDGRPTGSSHTVRADAQGVFRATGFAADQLYRMYVRHGAHRPVTRMNLRASDPSLRVVMPPKVPAR